MALYICMKQSLEDIKKLDKINRPREKLVARGVQSLTDPELLAIMIGTGTKDRKLHEICSDLQQTYNANGTNISYEDLIKVKGIGKSKAALLISANEFIRRKDTIFQFRVEHPEDLLPLLAPYKNKEQEYFIVIILSGAYEVIRTEIVTIGLLNRTMVHPREVFTLAVEERAAAIVVAHNHPSGTLYPSKEDLEITTRLKKAGEILGIPLLDHIIITKNGHYSFLAHHCL